VAVNLKGNERIVMRQTSGYGILRKAAPLVASYDASMVSHKAFDLFNNLCEALGQLPRTNYCGISRFPLQPLPSTDPAILRSFEDRGSDVHINFAARLRFLKFHERRQRVIDFDEDLLADYSTAAEVFSLLESPDDYEIVQLVRDPFCNNAECLGFDIGYWGGDHYSIICDSAVRPTWHPPQPECFEKLAKELSLINESFLFPSVETAARFRSYYRTQDWAEIESYPDEFCIIQVNKPR
jgi:hypothetical protein